MAQIIVLTSEAKDVLQPLIFNKINEMSTRHWPEGSYGQKELDMLHKIYADIVNSSR